MGKAIVATANELDLSMLVEQIGKLTPGESSYYLLQCPNKITDWKQGHPSATEIGEYTHGRSFGKKGELRWQKTAKGYLLLWLSEGKLPEGFKPLGTGEWEMSGSQNVFLLRVGATRIPRKLKYPINQNSPAVKAIQYKERNSQAVRFTRYVCFVQGG